MAGLYAGGISGSIKLCFGSFLSPWLHADQRAGLVGGGEVLIQEEDVLKWMLLSVSLFSSPGLQEARSRSYLDTHS